MYMNVCGGIKGKKKSNRSELFLCMFVGHHFGKTCKSIDTSPYVWFDGKICISCIHVFNTTDGRSLSKVSPC
jgi:hypothetical protein